MDIIDAHAHAFPDDLAHRAMHTMCRQGRWHPMRNHHDGTVAGLVAAMDRASITKTILCPVATKATQVEKITDWAASLASDRIVPFASIHPDHSDPEREIERAVQLGLRGLKFHPQYMGCAVDDPRCLRIARAAARARLPFTIHAGYHPAFDLHDEGSPKRIRALHDAIPELRIIACHMGGMGDWKAVLDFLAGSDIYLETSFVPSMCPPDELETILSRHDPRRILFGSDSPWTDSAQELADFRRWPLSPEAFALALGENVTRLLAGAAGA